MVGGGGSSGGIDVDDELVDGSKNPVAGGAVKSAIDELRKAVEDIEVGGGEFTLASQTLVRVDFYGTSSRDLSKVSVDARLERVG